MEIGGDSINFLDVKITIVNNSMQTTVYSKPTDSHLYLKSDSCHKKSTIRGIQKGVALRLRKICSSLMEYDLKSKEYMAYLVARGHDALSVKKTFDDVRNYSRNDVRHPTSTSKRMGVIFSTKYNPRGPNIQKIVNMHKKIINTPQLKSIFPNGIALVYKREKNLKELLSKADPYDVKYDHTSTDPCGYEPCNGCDSCDNFVLPVTVVKSYASGKSFRIRRNSHCGSKNVIYCAICTLCKIQGVGSTISWKPRLANYKNHIKKKIASCKIVEHFLDTSKHGDNPLRYLKFYIIDGLNNVESLSTGDVDDLLLRKEKLWIGMLLTQHKGMNASHDWKRKTRNDKGRKIEYSTLP